MSTQVHESQKPAGPEVPSNIEEVRNKTTDQLYEELNQLPLFMTSLENQEDNLQVEALKALAYEGEPHEVAENFRVQGNECFHEKQPREAIEYYDKAIAVKCGDAKIIEACWANRAACNLELRGYWTIQKYTENLIENYRRALNDCAKVFEINTRNVKAYFRSCKALIALKRFDEAHDCAKRGLLLNADNRQLADLCSTVSAELERRRALDNRTRQQNEQRKKESQAISVALKGRNYSIRNSARPPDLGEAKIQLETLGDPTSVLTIPVMLLYPLHSQTDFITAFPETSTFKDQLEVVLQEPPPWDGSQQYILGNVDLFAETTKGGLIKVGRKTTLFEVLHGGNVEILDGMVRITVVPKSQSSAFITTFKGSKGQPVS